MNELRRRMPIPREMYLAAVFRQEARAIAVAAERQGMGYPDIVQSGKPAEEAAPRVVLDNGRLVELTGWTPRFNLAQGLAAALSECKAENATRVMTG